MYRISLSAVVFLATVGLLAGPVWSAEVRTSKAELKIEQALSSPTQMEFIETPLQDVVDYLKDYHAIEIQVDRGSLDDIGVGADTPITKNLKGITLRSALNLMLREIDLTFTIADEVLLITTPEEAACRLITCVYPVDDLIGRSESGRLDEADGGLADYDSLIELMTSTVWANCHDKADGPSAICPITVNKTETLVITQTYDVHHRIAQLLKDLRLIANADPLAKPTPEKPPRRIPGSTPEKTPGTEPDPFGSADPFGGP